MKRYANIAPLVVLFVLFLQTGGLWMGIKSLQLMRIVQQEFRAKSNPSNAETFILSKENFHAYSLDGGKELEIGGLMFDVISIADEGDSVRVSALEDRFEARLITLLIHSSRSNPSNDKGDAYLFALMHLNFFLPEESCIRAFNFIHESDCHSEYIHPNWESCTVESTEQPPESKG